MERYTDRLIIREITQEDFADIHAYASNMKNILFMPWGPNNKKETKEFIDLCIKASKEEPRKEYHLGLCLKENNRLIGACEISLNRERNQGTLGWILHMDYWNQGYMTEVGNELLSFGFSELHLHRIFANCNSDNHGSYHVMEKIGMRREAFFVKANYGRNNGEEGWYDSYQYAILNSEWKNIACDR